MASCNTRSVFRAVFIRAVFVGALLSGVCMLLYVRSATSDIGMRAMSIYRADDQFRDRLSAMLAEKLDEFPGLEAAFDERDELMDALMDVFEESQKVPIAPLGCFLFAVPLMIVAALFISKPATRLDEFATSVAHDMRSPVESIVRDAKIAMRGGEQGKEALETVLSEGKLMLKMYDDILETTRNEAGLVRGEVVDIDFAEMVEDVVFVYTSSLEAKGCRMVSDVPAEPVMVRAHRAYLHSVVSNLVDNAVKFTEKGEVRVSLAPVGGKVVLQVEDTGCGMSRDCQRNAFVMFYREDMNDGEPGLGRGLARVKAIVDMYRGKVKIDSTKGVGTTITVTLPADMKPRRQGWLRRLAYQLS